MVNYSHLEVLPINAMSLMDEEDALHCAHPNNDNTRSSDPLCPSNKKTHIYKSIGALHLPFLSDYLFGNTEL